MSFLVNNVTFSYSKRKLLNGVSFEIGENESVCLLGPNGTGKTTLLRCLLGIRKVESGTITVFGKDIRRISAKERARYIAYVPQATTSVFPTPVIDMVTMGRNPHLSMMSTPSKQDLATAWEALELLNITKLANRSFTEISGGERQMVLIARAVAQQSKILIMDEPTASLDYSNAVRILQTIRKLTHQGYAVLMTSHVPNHAFICSKAALLKNGRMYAFGDPEEVITDEMMSQLYGVQVKVVDTGITEASGEQIRTCVPLMEVR